jgi:hypothetical protein
VRTSNIVAVWLPALGWSLGASFTEPEWVVSAYRMSDAALRLASMPRDSLLIDCRHPICSLTLPNDVRRLIDGAASVAD